MGGTPNGAGDERSTLEQAHTELGDERADAAGAGDGEMAIA